MSIFDKILGKSLMPDKNGEQPSYVQKMKEADFHEKIRNGEHVDRNMYMPPKNTRTKDDAVRQYDVGNRVQDGNRMQVEEKHHELVNSSAYIPRVPMDELRKMGDKGDVLFPVLCPNIGNKDYLQIGWVRAESKDIHQRGDGTCDILLNRPAYQIRTIDENGRRNTQWHSLPGSFIEHCRDDYVDRIAEKPVMRMPSDVLLNDIGRGSKQGNMYLPLPVDIGRVEKGYPDGVGYIRLENREIDVNPFNGNAVVTLERGTYGVKYQDEQGGWHNTRGLHPDVVAKEWEASNNNQGYVGRFGRMATESMGLYREQEELINRGNEYAGREEFSLQ